MSSAPVFLAALTRLFQEGHALVFWNDVGGEFAPQVDAISIESVKVLRLDRTPALQAKISIEREIGSRWLIYAPFDQPELAQDWLLDARLRGNSPNSPRLRFCCLPFSARYRANQVPVDAGVSLRNPR